MLCTTHWWTDETFGPLAEILVAEGETDQALSILKYSWNRPRLPCVGGSIRNIYKGKEGDFDLAKKLLKAKDLETDEAGIDFYLGTLLTAEVWNVTFSSGHFLKQIWRNQEKNVRKIISLNTLKMK